MWWAAREVDSEVCHFQLPLTRAARTRAMLAQIAFQSYG